MSNLLKNNEVRSRRTPLPTMYDLPSEEVGDPGMPDEYHVLQSILLRETFRPTAVDADKVFSAVDINLYYDPQHPLRYKRPDWFGAVGAPRFVEEGEARRSYVIWEEGITPLLVVELLSPGTEKSDLGQIRDADKEPTKWQVYEQILRVPYYVVFDGATNRLWIFRLVEARYEPASPNEDKLWIKPIELGLGIWQGKYDGLERKWLRFHDKDGNWIPTEREKTEAERREKERERQRAEAAQQQAEAERQRAEAALQQAEAERQEKEKAQARAELLVARLRELGIDPNQI